MTDDSTATAGHTRFARPPASVRQYTATGPGLASGSRSGKRL